MDPYLYQEFNSLYENKNKTPSQLERENAIFSALLKQMSFEELVNMKTEWREKKRKSPNPEDEYLFDMIGEEWDQRIPEEKEPENIIP